MFNPNEMQDFMDFMQMFQLYQQYKQMMPQQQTATPLTVGQSSTSTGQSVQIIENSENADLRAQVESLKAQLAEMTARAEAAEAQLSRANEQLSEMRKNVAVVETMEGRTIAEMAEEAIETTGDDYYDAHREEMRSLTNKQKHDLIADKMEEMDKTIKENRPEVYEQRQSQKQESKSRGKKVAFQEGLLEF